MFFGSQPTYRRVPSKTTITAQPASISVAVGGTAKFTVTVKGAGLSYQWQYKDPGKAWTNSGAPGAKTATLNVTASSAGYNGMQYRCTGNCCQNIYKDHCRVRQELKQLSKSDLTHIVVRIDIKHINDIQSVKAEINHLGDHTAEKIQTRCAGKAYDPGISFSCSGIDSQKDQYYMP